MTTDVADYRLIPHNDAELAERFGWIVGPVFTAFAYDADNLALVHQGTGAFSVVRPDTREFLACCPNLKYAKAFIARKLKGE